MADEEKSIKEVVLKAKKMEEEAIKADSDAATKKQQVSSRADGFHMCHALRTLPCCSLGVVGECITRQHVRTK